MALLVFLVQGTGFAQFETYNGSQPIVVHEDDISNITVDGNIDLVIRRDKPNDFSMMVAKRHSDKIRVTLVKSELYISAFKKNEERLVVYLWADELERLTMKGNSLVTSPYVLHMDRLTVFLRDESRIDLKTTGKISVNTRRNNAVAQGAHYSVVQSAQMK
jgi:hypothetical protein